MRGSEFTITKGEMTLGRRLDADVSLPLDPRISRQHCRLTYEDGRYWLEDSGSGNGTFVGNVRVRDKVHLPTGHSFRIGRTHLALREESESEIRLAAEQAVALVGDEQLGERLKERGTLDPTAVRARWTHQVAPDQQEVAGLRQRLGLFHEVASALGGKLELSELLDAIMDNLMQAVPAERGFLILVDEESRALRPQVVRKRGPQEEAEVKVSVSIVTKAVQERVAVLSSDAMADERFSERDSVATLQLRSVICAPLLHAGRVLGVIVLDNRSAARVFSQEDLELVTDIANQAAVALANAQLYTDLRGAYDELTATQERLVQSEKLSVIGTLSASIAHDIGNLITPISMVAALALEGDTVDPKLRESVERQTGRLRALTRQLLSFSKPKRVTKKPTDLNEIATASAKLLNTEARRAGVRLNLELAEDLPLIEADPDQLDQVFVNLILNGVQAMEGHDGDGSMTIVSTVEDGCVEVRFTDHGPGIPPEAMPHLFHPFFTTKGEQGTGLGLFSCRRIVEEEHGATLSVESELGVGTTFAIRFPREAIVVEGSA
jgi:signal transduction histidine kinase